MADHFPGADLGEIITDRSKAITQECVVGSVAVVKGYVVALEHYTLNMPKVVPANTAKAAVAIGVVTEYCDNGTGQIGERVLVVFKNAIVKVTAGVGGVTAGGKVQAIDTGKITAYVAAEKILGTALHTMAADDTGLLLLT